MLYALSRKHTGHFVVLQKAPTRSHRATLWHYREVSRTCSYELLCDATDTLRIQTSYFVTEKRHR